MVIAIGASSSLEGSSRISTIEIQSYLFGNELNLDIRDNNPFRYCCEYYDPELKAIYLRARNYRPEYGRFLSEDPAGDGTNWYAYCANEPVDFIDPSGMARGTATMYENGSPKYTVDLSTGTKYDFGTSMGQMASYGGSGSSSSTRANYNLSSSSVSPNYVAVYRLSSVTIGGVTSGPVYHISVNGEIRTAYTSADAAAIAFGQQYASATINDRVENAYRDREGQEYGGVIAEWKTQVGNLYTIENVVYSSMPEREYLVKMDDGTINPWSAPIDPRYDFYIPGATAVATIHTHTPGGEEDDFSRTRYKYPNRDTTVIPGYLEYDSNVTTAYMVLTSTQRGDTRGVRRASVRQTTDPDRNIYNNHWIYKTNAW